MNLAQRFIPTKFSNTRSGIKMVPKYITIHETDNTGWGANAEAHARLQENGNSRQASWHIQVDNNQAIQSIPFDEVAWAAGDGRGPGNMSSIHVEICVNQDGDYERALKNASQLVISLMEQFNIPKENIVPHKHWSGKNCPRNLLPRWEEFIDMCAPVKKENKRYIIKTGSFNDKAKAEKIAADIKKAHNVIVHVVEE